MVGYEDIRNARILENKARLSFLGLQKKLEDLRSLNSYRRTQKTPAVPRSPKPIYRGPTRRSPRLNQLGSKSEPLPVRRSSRLRVETGKSSIKVSKSKKGREEKQRRTPPPPPEEEEDVKPVLSPEESARRCARKGRGVVYSGFGISCHYCRQKTLCSEDDCKRCGELDFDQPCIGKTECSMCHSSYGVLCRGCLKVRYGEEMEEVREEGKKWMCPHCIEDQGINPLWICNSSICLKKRKMNPTGLAIYKARAMGYKSVAHFLMNELKGMGKKK